MALATPRSTNGGPNSAACAARQVNARQCPEREASDAKKLKALEVENAKLKKLLAEQMIPCTAA